LYALTLDNGSLSWTFEASYKFNTSSPAIGQSGSIYFGSGDYVYSLGSDGSLNWSYELYGSWGWGSVMIDDYENIYIGSSDRYLWALNKSGEYIIYYNTGQEIQSTPSVDSNGIVYYTCDTNLLLAVDPVAQDWLWTFGAGSPFYQRSPIIDSNGTIFVNSDKVYAINDQGNQVWEFNEAYTFMSTPAIGKDKMMYVMNSELQLVAIGQKGEDIDSIALGLNTDPEQSTFNNGDDFKIKLDLRTPKTNKKIDLYFVMLNPSNELFFGLGWAKTPALVAHNMTLPANLDIVNAPLMDISLPSTLPPVNAEGIYTFAMACAQPGTVNFISNIATFSFTYEVKQGPGDFEEKTFDGIDFIYLPPGTFTMGSESGPHYTKPAHTVTLTKGFWMSKYEITQAQYEAVTGENPSEFIGADKPVDHVDYYDSKIFAYDLGSGYRLPTDAEWEYACRGGTTTDYHFGTDGSSLGNYAWFTDNSGSETHPVGQKMPNPWGLYDMQGNVLEWVSDKYDEYYYEESPDTDPQGSDFGNDRVMRSSAWLSKASSCYSYSRGWYEPDFKSFFVGFRIVKDE